MTKQSKLMINHLCDDLRNAVQEKEYLEYCKIPDLIRKVKQLNLSKHYIEKYSLKDILDES